MEGGCIDKYFYIFIIQETKMDDLEKLLNERLEDKEFKKEWEEFQPKLQLMKEVIGKKIKENTSQKELSDKNN